MKRALALTSIGIGAGVLYALRKARGQSKSSNQVTPESSSENELNSKSTSMAPVKEGEPGFHFELDDRGTNQHEALGLLEKIKSEAFQSSDEKFALALGRPVEEVEAWASGKLPVDSDVLMKARGLALERGVNIQGQ
jgi:hypothetical protein